MLGALQAGSLFTGPRMLSNANHWGAVAFLAYCASILVLFRPWRLIPHMHIAWICILAALLILFGLVLAIPVVSETFASDACLDTGGSFDYVMSVCDRMANHPYIGLWWRSGFKLTVSVTSFISAIALAIVAKQRVRGELTLEVQHP